MYDFIAIDFETATSSMASACAVGIVAVKESKPVEKYYSLICPPKNEYDRNNIDIHGITPDQTETARAFSGIWPEISHFFNTHVPVVAHNPQFDMSVLRRSTDAEIPDFMYVNSMDIAAFFVEGSLSLENCAREMELNLDGLTMHNAQDDAWLCAYITVLGMHSLGCETLWELLAKYSVGCRPFSELKPIKNIGGTRKEMNRRAFPSNRTRDIKCQNEDVDQSGPLFGKNIVFTGQLSMDREEAMQLAADAGACVKSAVSKRTHFLVVGVQDTALVGASGMSAKERKAQALNEAELASIRILDEETFLKLLKGRS